MTAVFHVVFACVFVFVIEMCNSLATETMILYKCIGNGVAGGDGVWQAKLTFIHNYRYQQFKLWISTILIHA